MIYRIIATLVLLAILGIFAVGSDEQQPQQQFDSHPSSSDDASFKSLKIN